MTESTTLLVTMVADPDQPEALQQYVQEAVPMFQAAGGQLIKRLQVKATLKGTETFKVATIMDFPDAATIESLFASEAYEKLIPLRDKAFKEITIQIAEAI